MDALNLNFRSINLRHDIFQSALAHYPDAKPGPVVEGSRLAKRKSLPFQDTDSTFKQGGSLDPPRWKGARVAPKILRRASVLQSVNLPELEEAGTRSKLAASTLAHTEDRLVDSKVGIRDSAFHRHMIKEVNKLGILEAIGGTTKARTRRQVMDPSLKISLPSRAEGFKQLVGLVEKRRENLKQKRVRKPSNARKPQTTETSAFKSPPVRFNLNLSIVENFEPQEVGGEKIVSSDGGRNQSARFSGSKRFNSPQRPPKGRVAKTFVNSSLNASLMGKSQRDSTRKKKDRSGELKKYEGYSKWKLSHNSGEMLEAFVSARLAKNTEAMPSSLRNSKDFNTNPSKERPAEQPVQQRQLNSRSKSGSGRRMKENEQPGLADLDSNIAKTFNLDKLSETRNFRNLTIKMSSILKTNDPTVKEEPTPNQGSLSSDPFRLHKIFASKGRSGMQAQKLRNEILQFSLQPSNLQLTGHKLQEFEQQKKNRNQPFQFKDSSSKQTTEREAQVKIVRDASPMPMESSSMKNTRYQQNSVDYPARPLRPGCDNSERAELTSTTQMKNSRSTQKSKLQSSNIQQREKGYWIVHHPAPETEQSPYPPEVPHSTAHQKESSMIVSSQYQIIDEKGQMQQTNNRSFFNAPHSTKNWRGLPTQSQNQLGQTLEKFHSGSTVPQQQTLDGQSPLNQATEKQALIHEQGKISGSSRIAVMNKIKANGRSDLDEGQLSMRSSDNQSINQGLPEIYRNNERSFRNKTRPNPINSDLLSLSTRQRNAPEQATKSKDQGSQSPSHLATTGFYVASVYDQTQNHSGRYNEPETFPMPSRLNGARRSVGDPRSEISELRTSINQYIKGALLEMKTRESTETVLQGQKLKLNEQSKPRQISPSRPLRKKKSPPKKSSQQSRPPNNSNTRKSASVFSSKLSHDEQIELTHRKSLDDIVETRLEKQGSNLPSTNFVKSYQGGKLSFGRSSSIESQPNSIKSVTSDPEGSSKEPLSRKTTKKQVVKPRKKFNLLRSDFKQDLIQKGEQTLMVVSMKPPQIQSSPPKLVHKAVKANHDMVLLERPDEVSVPNTNSQCPSLLHNGGDSRSTSPKEKKRKHPFLPAKDVGYLVNIRHLIKAAADSQRDIELKQRSLSGGFSTEHMETQMRQSNIQSMLHQQMVTYQNDSESGFQVKSSERPQTFGMPYHAHARNRRSFFNNNHHKTINIEAVKIQALLDQPEQPRTSLMQVKSPDSFEQGDLHDQPVLPPKIAFKNEPLSSSLPLRPEGLGKQLNAEKLPGFDTRNNFMGSVHKNKSKNSRQASKRPAHALRVSAPQVSEQTKQNLPHQPLLIIIDQMEKPPDVTYDSTREKVNEVFQPEI